MNPELEGEISAIMHDAEITIAAQQINRDVDLGLLAETQGTKALKALMLTPALSQGANYTAALVVTALSKAIAMAAYILGVKRSDIPQLMGNDCEETDEPFQKSHELFDEIAGLASYGPLVHAVAGRLEAEIKDKDLHWKGKLLVHTFSVCGSVLREACKVRDLELTEANRGDEGDSRS